MSGAPTKIINYRGTTYTVPFADLLPPLTVAQYEALKVDIARRGIVVPVIVDEHGNIIDGQHRMTIAAELNLGFVPIKKAQPGLTEKQRRELCHDLNVHRRQLTAEERAATALKMRLSGQSFRQIGETLGVSHETARADIERATVKNLTVESTGTDELVEESLPERITGRDGKSRPATQPARTLAPPAPPAVEPPCTYPERDEPEWRTPEPREADYAAAPTEVPPPREPARLPAQIERVAPEAVRPWIPTAQQPLPTQSPAAQAATRAIVESGRDDYIAQDFNRLLAHLLGGIGIAPRLIRHIDAAEVAAVLTPEEVANGRGVLPMLEFVAKVYADYDRQKLRVVR